MKRTSTRSVFTLKAHLSAGASCRHGAGGCRCCTPQLLLRTAAGSEADTDQLYTCFSARFSSSLHLVTSCLHFESSFVPVCFILSLLHRSSLLSIVSTHLPSTLLFSHVLPILPSLPIFLRLCSL